jgi:hypothetical protein
MNRPALALFAIATLLAGACTASEPPPPQDAAATAAPPSTPSAVPASAESPAGAPEAVTPAKTYRPVKGTATVEVIRGAAKRVGADMVTVVQVKNMTNGRIDLLQIDEYWYDRDLKHVSGSMEKYRKPFNPGDVIEVTMKSPVKPNLYRNMLAFSHANGKIEAMEVKKFKDPE